MNPVNIFIFFFFFFLNEQAYKHFIRIGRHVDCVKW